MSQPAQRAADTSPAEPKGRVLYIGASYYNNWYLSRELRKLGWRTDFLFSCQEGAEAYLHGYDFFLRDFVNWDGRYPRRRFEFLQRLLKTYVQTVENGGYRPKLARLTPVFKWLARLIAQSTPGLICRAIDIGWASPWLHRLLLRSLLASPDPELLKKLTRLFLETTRQTPLTESQPLFDVLDGYDILQFTVINNLHYFYFFNPYLFGPMPIGWDIQLLKRLGKKIVYSNVGCLDGVSQSSFRAWPPEPVCDICRWRDAPDVCSDERNLAWGRLRNSLTDYQITLGGNRKDYNDDPQVHEVPEFYCLDTEVWKPDLPVPPEYRLPLPTDTVKIYHSVGNFGSRTMENNRNIKCTHIYIPLIEHLKAEGYNVELIFFTNVPNRELRFYQVQADIFVDMLTFGFFGATAREGMMLGKPIVCFLRPEWLESMRREIPAYVDELPVISATPQTVYEVLKDLIENPEKRREIGRRSREFAVKWHSAEAGARRFDQIYRELLD